MNTSSHIVMKRQDIFKYLNGNQLKCLDAILNTIIEGRKRDGKKTVNSYYVCNTDEPYANEVLKVILKSEKGESMTTYNQVKNYKTTEFYNIDPTNYFAIFDMCSKKHCLCLKVTDSSYLNIDTCEYVKLQSDNLDMMVSIVEAKVDWCYALD